MPTQNQYTYANLPNAGIGNRLLTWARCVVYSTLHQLPRIAPQWKNIKIGPILRRESDWRWYLGQFSNRPDDVTGLKRLYLLNTLKRLPEPDDFAHLSQDKGIVEFNGLADYFKKLNEHSSLLRTELLNAVNPRWRHCGIDKSPAPIAIHIRRGDFKNVATLEELKSTGNARTPLDWFVETLQKVREVCGKNIPAFVMTDGTKEELKQLFDLPDVHPAATGSAIGDLLTLSKARILIGSGGSTFSLWGAFLSQCPAVFPPGQDPNWFHLRNMSGRYLGIYNPWQADPLVTNELASYCQSRE